MEGKMFSGFTHSMNQVNNQKSIVSSEYEKSVFCYKRGIIPHDDIVKVYVA